MQSLRCFIALNVPDDLRSYLIRRIKSIGINLDDYRLTAPENIHVTLKFLGETSVEDLPKIISALEQVISRHDAFPITVTQGITMPKNHPTVMAMSVESSPELIALHSDIETILADHGLAQREFRQFRPHITLARARSAQLPPSDQPKITSWQESDLTATASEIILMESQLTPQGPIYTPLMTYHLSV